MKADDPYGESIIRFAYEQANDILNGRDGAGFRFIVTMKTGKTYDVISAIDDDLTYPARGIGTVAFWKVENGDNLLLLAQSQIESIEVYEC